MKRKMMHLNLEIDKRYEKLYFFGEAQSYDVIGKEGKPIRLVDEFLFKPMFNF
jgi:hypothetical protein